MDEMIAPQLLRFPDRHFVQAYAAHVPRGFSHVRFGCIVEERGDLTGASRGEHCIRSKSDPRAWSSAGAAGDGHAISHGRKAAEVATGCNSDSAGGAAHYDDCMSVCTYGTHMHICCVARTQCEYVHVLIPGSRNPSSHPLIIDIWIWLSCSCVRPSRR